jgi:hypothetical protein
MSRSIRCLIVLLTLALIASSAVLFRAPVARALPLPIRSQVVQTYSESFDDFPNPERGWNNLVKPVFVTNAPAPALTLAQLQGYRAQNITMVRKYYLLIDFKNSALSQALLDSFSADLAVARQAGVKLIPRFIYNYNAGFAPGANEDAPVSRVLGHIEQLRPLFQANADVIALVEAGFIGLAGEWQGSSNNLVLGDHTFTDASRQIISALLNALPKDRSIVLRYPKALREGLYAKPLKESAAFSGSDQARVGFHDDGAFADWANHYDIERSYVKATTRFTPMTGEPADDSEYSRGVDPFDSLGDYHYGTFTRTAGDASGLYDHWQWKDVYSEITRRIGYRFSLIDADIPTSLAPGSTFTMNFRVKNSGFGSPFNARLTEIVLRNTSTQAEYYATLQEDPRRWWAGATQRIEISAGLPENIPTGNYQVFLNLPDPADSLYGRPEYSIRLANTGLWEHYSGYNNLQVTLSVNTQATVTPYRGDVIFTQRTTLPQPSNPPAPTPTPTPNTEPDVTYTFTDVPTGEAPFDGLHAGIDFGSEQWFRGPYFGFSRSIYFATGSMRAATFILPEGKVLKQISLGTEQSATYVINDGVNYLTGQLSVGPTTNLTTNWQKGGREIRIYFSKGEASGIGSITYGNAVATAAYPDVPPIPDLADNDVLITFGNRPSGESTLSGSYQGITWGSGWKTVNNNGEQYLLPNSSNKTNTLTFTLPAGKVLKSVGLQKAVRCGTNHELVLEASGNDTLTYSSIAPWWAIHSTGWRIPATTVTVKYKGNCSTGGRNLWLDNIVYGDPPIPDTAVTFEDLTIGQTLTGVYGGIDWGTSGIWKVGSDGTYKYVYMNTTTVSQSLSITLPDGMVLKSLDMGKEVQESTGQQDTITFATAGQYTQSWSYFPTGGWNRGYGPPWEEPSKIITVTASSTSSKGASNIRIDLLTYNVP